MSFSCLQYLKSIWESLVKASPPEYKDFISFQMFSFLLQKIVYIH